MTPPPRAAVARIALTRSEAAAALGVSVDHLERHVLPYLRVAHVGRRVLVPVKEIERWLDEAAEPVLPDITRRF